MITFTRIGYLGRLGNQMFQMASTIGIAKKLGLECYFPLEHFLNGINTDQNSYDGCKLMDCFDIDRSLLKPINQISKNISNIYGEQCFKFDPQTGFLPDDVDLYGYFQTEKYFMTNRELILSIFEFKPPITEASHSYIETIRNSNKGYKIASIHVRRGDYVALPNHHPVCDSKYYKSAISKIKENGEPIKFIVFSDDPNWCKSEFQGEDFIISELGNTYQELYSMSLCDHHIIANSSFSWWGAWLNRSDKKIVIAPSRWFGPSLANDTSDIYCENWIKI